MDYNQTLSLENICGGAASELFERELKALLSNIRDPNTPADGKRSITLEFQFEPFDDRSGAQVKLVTKSKHANVDPHAGSVFFALSGEGKMEAYSHDPRQDNLFGTEASINKKQKHQ